MRTIQTLSFSLVATAALLSGCGQSVASAPVGAKTPPSVTVIHPEKLVVQDALDYTGRFEPSRKVEVRSRISGYLQAIKFRDGQQVTAGDPLFVVDDRPFVAAHERAQASLAQAMARHKFSAAQYDRVARLHRSNASSAEDVDRTRSEMESAEAAVLAARAELRSAALELSFTTVRAPISGRVSDRRVDVGSYLVGGAAQGGVLTTIVAQHPVHAVVELTEADFRRLRRQEGLPDKVELILDGEDRPRTATVDFLDNEFSARSGTVRMRASLANRDGAALPGNFLQMRIPLGQPQQRLVVPDAAIQSDQAKKMVMVVNGNKEVALKTVELGTMVGAKRVILSGLDEKDQVVVSGAQRVRPGDKVQVAMPRSGA